MRLLCFDPGGTTGWAFFADGEITGGAFPTWERVKEVVDAYQPTVILLESFHLRQNAASRLVGSSFPTIEVIGIIKYIAKELGIPCVVQTPPMRIGIHLKRWIPTLGTHSRDAAKHGIRYLISQGLIEPYEHYRLTRRSRGRW